MTRRSDNPLARAVVTYSRPMTSNILERVTRAMTAAETPASVIDGSTRWVSRSNGPPLPRMSDMPFDGNQPSPSENVRISTRPSQKVGMLLPNRAPSIANRSNAESGRVAEITPADTPSTIDTSMLATARIAVFLNRSSTIVVTGARSSIERPRSPRSARAGQHLRGVAGDQLHQQEDDDADPEQDRDGRHEAPENVGTHAANGSGGAGWACSSPGAISPLTHRDRLECEHV